MNFKIVLNFPAIFQLINSDVTSFTSENFPIFFDRVTTMRLKK